MILLTSLKLCYDYTEKSYYNFTILIDFMGQ